MKNSLLILFILTFLYSPNNYSQQIYNSNGSNIGRVNDNQYYDGTGKFIGKTSGDNIYNSNGSNIGRIDDNYLYNGSGSMIGRTNDNYLYDRTGSNIGRIGGDYIYDGSGKLIIHVNGLSRKQIIVYFYFFY